MSLSCYFGKVSSSLYKGSVLNSWSKRLIRPSCSVYIVRQPYCQQFLSPQSRNKELTALHGFSWESFSLVGVSRKFSTSSSRLAQHKSHDHSKLWTFERFLAASLLPLVPAALAYPSQTLDTALALVIVLHTHFGLEAIIVDYIRPILFGEVIPKISIGFLYLLSIVTLAGLLNLIYNDAGLANTLITIWKK